MIDTDTTPDVYTTSLLDMLDAHIRVLPEAADRCWAWSRVGHDVAAAEISRTPAGEPASAAIFGYGALLDAMTDLEDCGVAGREVVDSLVLDRDQARRLLPHILERVMWETSDPTTPAMQASMAVILADVADSYVAMVGHLPDRELTHE